MPKQIAVAEHSTIAQLEQLYKQANGGVESRKARWGQLTPADFTSVSNYLAIIVQGKKTEEVTEITRYSRTGIYTLVKRYNESGVEELGDFHYQNIGASPLIDDAQQSQLWQVLPEKAPDGGLWNGRTRCRLANSLDEVTNSEIIFSSSSWNTSFGTILIAKTLQLRWLSTSARNSCPHF